MLGIDEGSYRLLLDRILNVGRAPNSLTMTVTLVDDGRPLHVPTDGACIVDWQLQISP